MDTMHGRLVTTLACINLHVLYYDQALSHYGQEGLNATVLPTHTNIKIKIISWNDLIFIWAVSRDSLLPHGGLTEAKLLL